MALMAAALEAPYCVEVSTKNRASCPLTRARRFRKPADRLSRDQLRLSELSATITTSKATGREIATAFRLTERLHEVASGMRASVRGGSFTTKASAPGSLARPPPSGASLLATMAGAAHPDIRTTAHNQDFGGMGHLAIGEQVPGYRSVTARRVPRGFAARSPPWRDPPSVS